MHVRVLNNVEIITFKHRLLEGEWGFDTKNFHRQIWFFLLLKMSTFLLC
jgi:hypothetical protein